MSHFGGMHHGYSGTIVSILIWKLLKILAFHFAIMCGNMEPLIIGMSKGIATAIISEIFFVFSII